MAPQVRQTLALISLGCLPLLAGAEAMPEDTPPLTPDQSWTANFYFENDLFTDTDQQYTNGVRLSFVSPEIDSFLDDPDLPGWMRDANRWLAPLDPEPVRLGESVSRRLIVTLGQLMFTPKTGSAAALTPMTAPMPVGSIWALAITPKPVTA